VSDDAERLLLRIEAAVRAEDANVGARDRKMAGAVAVTSEARRAFANQAGLLLEASSALDTRAAKTPLPVHKFH
jgi:hypothetical protein